MKSTAIILTCIIIIFTIVIISSASLADAKHNQCDPAMKYLDECLQMQTTHILQWSNTLMNQQNQKLEIQNNLLQIQITMMQNSTDVWYQGFNEREILMYRQGNNQSPTGFSCGYWDILKKINTPMRDC